MTYPIFQIAPHFITSMHLAFRDWNKRDFYAWQYGNYKAMLTWKDHKEMYCMGGEL